MLWEETWEAMPSLPVACGPDSQAHKNPLQVLGPQPRRQIQQVLGQPRNLHSSGSEAPPSCSLEKIGQVSTQSLRDGLLTSSGPSPRLSGSLMGLASSSWVRKAVAPPGPALWLAHSVPADISVLGWAIDAGASPATTNSQEPQASHAGSHAGGS